VLCHCSPCYGIACNRDLSRLRFGRYLQNKLFVVMFWQPEGRGPASELPTIRPKQLQENIRKPTGLIRRP
jgi:hypothetical protein